MHAPLGRVACPLGDTPTVTLHTPERESCSYVAADKRCRQLVGYAAHRRAVRCRMHDKCHLEPRRVTRRAHPRNA